MVGRRHSGRAHLRTVKKAADNIGFTTAAHIHFLAGLNVPILSAAAFSVRTDCGNGRFWTSGESFPSGHAMETWALPKVLADQYYDKALVKFGMYGLATAVSVSRVTAERHYAWDVLIGSAIGYLIGKFVMRHHSKDK